MKLKRITAMPLAVLAAVALVTVAPSDASAQSASKIEAKCTAALAKTAGKLAASLASDTTKCLLNNDAGSCPDTKISDKIAKNRAKLLSTAGKKCVSTCTVSGLTCIDDLGCPPNGSSPENCNAGAKNQPMSASRVGFPGSLCGTIEGPDDIGACVADVAQEIGETIVTNVTGSIDATSGLSKDAEKCLGKLGKAVGKTASSIAKAVSKCRAKVSLEATDANDLVSVTVATCQTADEKTAASVAKAQTKLSDTVTKSCPEAVLAELDLCGAGVGGIATLADAQECLVDVATEAGSTTEPVGSTDFVAASIINAAYPDSVQPFCGDGRVNEVRNQFALIGEECDGDNDAACPGECLPPGDAFECTCGNIPRARRFTDGFAAALDSGWTGRSHNNATPDRAGFISTLSNCDCSEFDAIDTATCIGASGDPICDVFTQNEPRCNWAVGIGDPSCDAFGNGNGAHADDDCFFCTAESANAGASCSDESDCDSLCYDDMGVAGAACVRQSDCGAGETCRGRCNKQVECVKSVNGAPLPLSSSGTQTCVRSEFFSDITGTSNIVTGEHAINYELRSRVFLASKQTRPCPTCGGTCFGGERNGEVCEGTCSVTSECRFGDNNGASCTSNGDCTGAGECWGLSCRFDSDCPGSETCTTTTPTCGELEPGVPATCQLDLICSGGTNAGESCRIEAYTAFGTTSDDCQPEIGQNISGDGLSILFTPTTSEVVQLPAIAPCNAAGFENYDCNCVLGGGSTRNRPNLCAASCDAGAEFGTACADGNTGAGIFTSCTGGTEAGAACDEDSDCDGGTCSTNPLHCTAGDPAKNRNFCAANSDCDTSSGSGDGVCGDACPSGRCVPLCSQLGECDGGSRDGLTCADDEDCDGGTCNVIDTEVGACNSGNSTHCSNDFEFIPCLPNDVGTDVGCGADIPGAGLCVSDSLSCHVLNGLSEGGDTLNGLGDPSNFLTVAAYCVPATSSGAVNSAAGLPGPGRLRAGGTGVINVTSIP